MFCLGLELGGGFLLNGLILKGLMKQGTMVRACPFLDRPVHDPAEEQAVGGKDRRDGLTVSRKVMMKERPSYHEGLSFMKGVFSEDLEKTRLERSRGRRALQGPAAELHLEAEQRG